MTQNNLGNALGMLGEHESGTARLEEAVAAYRGTLKERTRERVPLQWATTQNNLGAALRMLGERESGTARLEEAVAAYREALKEHTRERVPLDWAMMYHNQTTEHNAHSYRRFASELVALAPDVLVTAGAPAVEALQRMTRTVPIVFVTITDPVGGGLVASLARPGGNTTGFTFSEFGGTAQADCTQRNASCRSARSSGLRGRPARDWNAPLCGNWLARNSGSCRSSITIARQFPTPAAVSSKAGPNQIPNIWGAFIGRPGLLKSPAMGQALKPIHRLESEVAEVSTLTSSAGRYSANRRDVGSLTLAPPHYRRRL